MAGEGQVKALHLLALLASTAAEILGPFVVEIVVGVLVSLTSRNLIMSNKRKKQ